MKWKNLQEYQLRWFLEFCNELRRQKRILEFVEPFSDICTEARILLEGHTIVARRA